MPLRPPGWDVGIADHTCLRLVMPLRVGRRRVAALLRCGRGGGGMTVDPRRRRLTTRDRWRLTALTALSIVVVFAGLATAVFTTLHFFGEQPTAREQSISDQAVLVAVWAAATPLLVWWFLRRSRAWPVAAILWLALLRATRPWFWPTRPLSVFDMAAPIWWS